MRVTNSSYSTADFLYCLNYLLDDKIINIHTGNSSEFQKCFSQALIELNFNHCFYRPKTPKDNSTNERFNRTLEEEFI
jgi:transposase InsO family protein